MPTRKAFTLIELLVCIVIIVILAAFFLPMFGGGGGSDPVTGKSYYDIKTTKNYRVIKTYDVASGESSTSKRVDVVEVNEYGKDTGSPTTFTVDDDWWDDVEHSATLYAGLENDKFYTISTTGFRREDRNFPKFPNVSAVQTFTPKQSEAEAEIDFP